MGPAIVLDRVACRYRRGVTAFTDLSLSVARGEVFGLLGNNGAGKSSLIKILCGLLRPTAGTTRVLGIDVVDDPVTVKRRIGVMPQENNLDTALDVRRNLLFHCRYFGLSARESTARVAQWLDLLGLADKAGESVLTLSGGTRRKVMLAKAFLTEPELLILDEPTTGLDPEVREFVWRQITAFRAVQRTVFLSTHYLEEAERLCDRVAIIHRGALAALGPVGELTVDADGEVARKRGLGEVFRSAVGSIA